MEHDKTYLGDGVYASFDGWQIKLTCDCMSEPNAIFLEPGMIQKLNIFFTQMTKPATLQADASELGEA